MDPRITTTLAALTLFACGGAPVDRAFPTAGELRKIAKRPAPEIPTQTPVSMVDEWQLAGPFPDAPGGPPAAGAPGVELLGASPVAAPSAAMTCTARELARFAARNPGLAPGALRSFVVARCGSTGSGLQMTWISGEVAPGEDAAAVLTRWAPGPSNQVAAMGQGLGQGGTIGGASAMHEGKAVWMVVGQTAGQRFDGFTGLPDADGRVLPRGARDPRHAQLSALVTQGRFRYGVCEPLQAPEGEYAFACPIDPADEMATIEAVGVPAQQVLGDTIASMTAWPSGAPVDVWRASSKVEPRPVNAAEQVPGAIVEGLNALRRASGVEPVVLDPAQSTELRGLAPHYWSAVWRDDAALVDRIALGVMAGWRVGASVRQGNFAGSATDDRLDVGVLLRDMLDSPFHRRMLLDPATRRLAVGGFLPGDGRLAVVVGGYHVVDVETFDSAGAAVALRAHLDAQRARRNHAALEPWAAIESELRTLADAVSAGRITSEAVLDLAVQRASQLSRGPVAGRVIQVSALEQIELPPALAGADAVPVALAVGVERSPGHPWVRNVVLMVWPHDARAQAHLARLGPTAR